MRNRQLGATTLGYLIIAFFVGMVAFAILRVAPIYIEQLKISMILDDVKRDFKGKKTSPAQIRSAINRRINIEMIRDMDARQFKISKSTTGGFDVQASYERREPYIANIYLVVVFDKTVEITQ
jgi:hypothetical protein